MLGADWVGRRGQGGLIVVSAGGLSDHIDPRLGRGFSLIWLRLQGLQCFFEREGGLHRAFIVNQTRQRGRLLIHNRQEGQQVQ